MRLNPEDHEALGWTIVALLLLALFVVAGLASCATPDPKCCVTCFMPPPCFEERDGGPQ